MERTEFKYRAVGMTSRQVAEAMKAALTSPFLISGRSIQEEAEGDHFTGYTVCGAEVRATPIDGQMPITINASFDMRVRALNVLESALRADLVRY